MRITSIAKIVGIFLIIFSLSMLPPILVNWLYDQHNSMEFIATFLLSLASGLLLWVPFHRSHYDVKVRDGFLIVVLFWVVLSLYGAFPFMVSSALHLSFTNAFYEAVSGLTTTGSTVILHIDGLPSRFYFIDKSCSLLVVWELLY